MNRTLQSRLAKLESARPNPLDAMTDTEVEARIQQLVKEMGGFEAVIAGLDDSYASDRRLREAMLQYRETGFLAST